MGPWVSGISKKPRSGNWMPFQGARRFVFWQHWFLWRPRSAAGHQARPPVPPPPAPLAPLIPPPEEPSLLGHHSASLPRTRIFSVFLRVCWAAPVPAALQGGLANLAAQPAPGFTDARPDPGAAGRRRHGAGLPTPPSILLLLPGVTFNPGPNVFLENVWWLALCGDDLPTYWRTEEPPLSY